MKQKFKKIACALSLTVVLCGASAFVAPLNVQAQSHQVVGHTTVSVSNGSFASNPTSSYLDTSPSGWTGSSNGQAKKGIINVNTNSQKFDYNCTSSYHLSSTENPGKAGTDDKVLMLNARKANVEDKTSSTVDFFKSNDITLEANSYYKLSVWVHTQDSGRASITLSGLSEDDQTLTHGGTYFSDIQTPGHLEWQEYSYYIATNASSQTVNLNLYLGAVTETNQIPSFGAVFYDEVTLEKCSESYFNQFMQDETSSLRYAVISYDKHIIDTTSLNLGFENGLNGWQQFGTYEDAIFTAGAVSTSSLSEGADLSANNTKALKISADENGKAYVGFKSEAFNIDMASTYRISVMAKATNVVGSAQISLVEEDYAKETYNLDIEPKTETITFSTTESNQLTNGYQEFVFYVSGYELYDTKAHLELILGEETVPASGDVVFDSITIAKFSAKQFEELSTSATTEKKITFTSITGTPSFTNGNFNKAFSETINTTYPLTPKDWTLTESTTSTVFGVVNTTRWENIPLASKPLQTSPLNPSIMLSNGTLVPVADTSSNNILMMFNPTASRQVVTSPTFTAETNKFYSLTFNYRTFGNALTLKITDADKNVVYSDKIASNTAWDTYKLTLRTEHFETETLSIVFELDNTESTLSAHAFFDNFQFYEATSYTAENFSQDENLGLNTLDLSNLGIHQTGELGTNGVYEAILFNGKLESGSQTDGADPIAFGGIIDDENQFGVEFPDTHTNAIKNMIALQTLAQADYSLTSKNTISLKSGNYYKFSIYVQTSFTTAPNTENEEDYGAYFKLVGIDDAVISHITSNGSFNQYSIFLSPAADANVNIQFGLKSQTLDNQSAYFDTFAFETIDKAAFDKATNSSTTLVLENANAEDETPDEETSSTGMGNIWIEISTLVMILAIVIAVIGGLIRKRKSTKIKAKKHAQFVQKASLVRDASMVEAEQRRAQEIANLMKEKEELNAHLKNLEAENKARLAETRKTSGKVITRKAEKAFKLYASNRQKLVRDISRIDARIKEAETPEYLARIAKIVQAEKVKQMEQDSSKQQPTEPKQDD